MIEQNIEVEQDQSEQAIGINREQSVLHGIDGVSPIATVTQTATGATISITDRNGTTTADITNGQDGSDGADGFSPTATVTKSGKVATITITDKNGTTTAQISDGSGASITETDPIFTASPAHSITNADITAWNNKSDFSGDYDDLTNKPTIPTAGTITSGSTGYATGGDVYAAIGNIETILSTLNNGGGAQ